MTVITPTLSADDASFHRFHTVDLPERLAAGNGALAFAELAPLGTLAIATPAGTFTYVPCDGSVDVREGDVDADTVVEMDLDSWLGLVSDLDTAPSLFYGGRVTATKGKPLRFVRWEPGLRAMFHGLPPFDPDTADLRDLEGNPLDPTTMFEIDDLDARPEEMRHFLTTAGYLVVRDVFEAEAVSEMLSDVSVLHDEARPGDGAVVVGPRRRWRRGALPGARRQPLGPIPFADRSPPAEAPGGTGPGGPGESGPRRDGQRDRVVEAPGRHRGPGRPPLAPRLRHGWPCAELPDDRGDRLPDRRWPRGRRTEGAPRLPPRDLPLHRRSGREGPRGRPRGRDGRRRVTALLRSDARLAAADVGQRPAPRERAGWRSCPRRPDTTGTGGTTTMRCWPARTARSSTWATASRAEVELRRPRPALAEERQRVGR